MLTKNQCLAARETIRANKIIKCQTQNDKKKNKNKTSMIAYLVRVFIRVFLRQNLHLLWNEKSKT